MRSRSISRCPALAQASCTIFKWSAPSCEGKEREGGSQFVVGNGCDKGYVLIIFAACYTRCRPLRCPRTTLNPLNHAPTTSRTNRPNLLLSSPLLMMGRTRCNAMRLLSYLTAGWCPSISPTAARACAKTRRCCSEPPHAIRCADDAQQHRLGPTLHADMCCIDDVITVFVVNSLPPPTISLTPPNPRWQSYVCQVAPQYLALLQLQLRFSEHF